MAYGLAYIAPIAPLTTLGYVWLASAGTMVASYLLGVACMFLTAYSYVRMNRVRRDAGSVYAFAGQVLGPGLGFLAGWMLLLDYLLMPALVHVMMAIGMQAVVPSVSRTVWLVVAAAVTAGVNLRGLRLSIRVSWASVLLQLVFLAVFLGLCAGALGTQRLGVGWSLAPLYDAPRFEFTAVLSGAGLALLGFLGFDAISTLAEETRDDDPDRVGRATMAVLGLCGVLFIAAAWTLGNLMPAVPLRDPATAIFDLTATVLGPAWVLVVALVMVVLVGFTNALPMQTGVARVLFAMARDGRLPAPLARVHPRRHTPDTALVAAAVASFAVSLGLLDHPDLLASIVNFGALSAFALLHLAVLRHDARGPKAPSAVARSLPALGLAVVLAVAFSLPGRALELSALWALAGAGVGWWWRPRPSDAAP